MKITQKQLLSNAKKVILDDLPKNPVDKNDKEYVKETKAAMNKIHNLYDLISWMEETTDIPSTINILIIAASGKQLKGYYNLPMAWSNT